MNRGVHAGLLRHLLFHTDLLCRLLLHAGLLCHLLLHSDPLALCGCRLGGALQHIILESVEFLTDALYRGLADIFYILQQSFDEFSGFTADRFGHRRRCICGCTGNVTDLARQTFEQLFDIVDDGAGGFLHFVEKTSSLW